MNPENSYDEVARSLAGSLMAQVPDVQVSMAVLHRIIVEALSTRRVVEDVSEALRMSKEEAGDLLTRLGALNLVSPSQTTNMNPDNDGWSAAATGIHRTFGIDIHAKAPGFPQKFAGDRHVFAQLDAEWLRVREGVLGNDPFLNFYRRGISAYCKSYISGTAKDIKEFVARNFSAGDLKYLLTVGIGANEQFWHFPQRLHQRDLESGVHWIICDNPKDLLKLPNDASPKNTLIMEFSRSGKTQEVVKVHEFLRDDIARIVFASSGPLHELGKRSARSLVCEVPDDIPGRFAKNLSPMLLAPLTFLDYPVLKYWEAIEEVASAWDLTDDRSPPAAIARYIRAAQLLHGANHIYLGTNDDLLLGCCDELVQFWNEGVNKERNDLSMSRYFGLPRDSHLNIEGILGNSSTKAGIFVLKRSGAGQATSKLTTNSPKFYNPEHAGLTIDAVDFALAKANADHFGQLMPTITIEVDDPSLTHSFILSQLWTDVVYCYSRMVGVNPGSNPEVRHVRDRADQLMISVARGIAADSAAE